MSDRAEEVTAIRGIAAVVGTLLLFSLATRMLEQTFATLAVTALLNVIAAFVVGFVGARIAGARETTVVGVAAAVETCMLAFGWSIGAYDALPIWVRALLVLTTGPAMMAGAWIRMQARLATGASATGEQA